MKRFKCPNCGSEKTSFFIEKGIFYNYCLDCKCKFENSDESYSKQLKGVKINYETKESKRWNNEKHQIHHFSKPVSIGIFVVVSVCILAIVFITLF